MTIIGLDHFTIRSSRLEQTCDFFERVAGLKVGPRPPFSFDGRWLYQGEWAAVHLAVQDPADAGINEYLGSRGAKVVDGSGVVDHIAFRCSDLPEFEARLKTLGVAYRGRTVPDQGEHQVFVDDPNGVTVEFIFNATEISTWA